MEESQIKGTEMKHLQRVFKYMANFVAVNAIREKITPKAEKRRKLLDYKKEVESMQISESGSNSNLDDIEKEIIQLESEIKELEGKIDEIQIKSDQKIRPQDLSEVLRKLGRVCTKKEIDDLIWEVDEDLDGCVNWEEFLLMYERSTNDKSGLEPFQFYTIVQFCMFDKDATGKINVDNTMDMLFRRYGREQFDAQLRRLFGDVSKDVNKELTFADYLKAVILKPKRILARSHTIQ